MSRYVRIDLAWKQKFHVEKMAVRHPEWFETGVDVPVSADGPKNVREFVKILLRIRLEETTDELTIRIPCRDGDDWDHLRKGGGKELQQMFVKIKGSDDKFASHLFDFLTFVGRGKSVDVQLSVLAAEQLLFRCRLPQGQVQLTTPEQFQILLDAFDQITSLQSGASHEDETRARLGELRERLIASLNEDGQAANPPAPADAATESVESTETFRVEGRSPLANYRIERTWHEPQVAWHEALLDQAVDSEQAAAVIAGRLKVELDERQTKIALQRIRRVHRLSPHPCLTAVTDAGMDEGRLLFVETRPAGKPLDEWIEDNVHLPSYGQQCAALISKAANALAHLHNAGLTHLHLAPSRIFVTEQSRPQIWGAALGSVLGQLPSALAHASFDLSFRAPEQVDGWYAGEAADIYSLAAVLYYMLTGSPPFVERDETGLRSLIRGEVPPAPKTITISEPISRACLKCLAKEPFDRYPTMRQFAADLEQLARGPRLRRDDALSEKTSQKIFDYDVYISGWGVDPDEFDQLIDVVKDDLQLNVFDAADDPGEGEIRDEYENAVRGSRVILIPCTTQTIDSGWAVQQVEWADDGRASVVPIVLEKGLAKDLPQLLQRGNVLDFFDLEADARYEQLAKATKRRWWLPHADNRERFVDELRQNELCDLTEALETHHVCLVYGATGMGKSDLATFYAYKYQDRYDGNVLWINCHGDYERASDLAEIARRAPEHRNQITAKRNDPPRVIHRLARQSRRLLILDDVQDADFLAKVLQERPRSHMLITSQKGFRGPGDEVSDRALPAEARIKLLKFDSEQSLEFVARRANRGDLLEPAGGDYAQQQEREAARNLLREIDGFPLVLDQIANLLAQTRMSLVRLWNEYQETPVKVLRSVAAEEAGADDDEGRRNRRSLVRLISMYYSDVCAEDEVAANILHICCFLHHEQIPRELFQNAAAEIGLLAAGDDDQLTSQQVARHINALAPRLIQYEAGERFFHITHQLVHAVLRDILRASDRYQEWAEKTVEILNRAFPLPTFQQWPICERYMRHVQVATGCIEELPVRSVALGRLLRRFAVFIAKRYARLHAADELLVRAVSAFPEEAALHPDRVFAYISSCNCAQDREMAERLQQAATEARSLCQSILDDVLRPIQAGQAFLDEASERFLIRQSGQDHQDEQSGKDESASHDIERALYFWRYWSIWFDTQLAVAYKMRHEYEKAAELSDENKDALEKLKDEWEAALPEDFEEDKPEEEVLVDSARSLDLNEPEDHEAAQKIVAEILSTRVSSTDHDNPGTADQLAVIGGLAWQMEDWTLADAAYTQATRMRMRLYHPLHDYVADVMRLVAQVRSKTQRFQHALRLNEQVIENYTTVFSKSHGTVVGARLERAWILAENGEYDDAFAEVEAVRAVSMESSWGSEIADSLQRFAVHVCKKSERWDEARVLLREAKELYERTKQTESVEFAACLRNQAHVLAQRKDRRSLDDIKRLLGEARQICARLFEKHGPSRSVEELRRRLDQDIDNIEGRKTLFF